jgi:hypothetical protein
VAHIERTGDINDRGLGQAKATQYIFGDFKNALRGQHNDFVHGNPVLFSAASDGLAGQFLGLRRQMARNLGIEPVVDQSSQMNDFCGHGSISAVSRQSFLFKSPRVRGGQDTYKGRADRFQYLLVNIV